MPAVGRRAPEHGAQRGLDARGRLVVELAAGDAFDESLFLFRVSLVERAVKNAGGRKLFLCVAAPASARGSAQVELPRVVADDAHRMVIVRFGCALAAEESLADIPPAFINLGGVEAD